ncbi:MAG: SAM-dependent methyltransferase [Candidatus Pacebacteria bacterium CG_4_10_14_0_8_um_filter_42_14]|nr:MAG: SAM-dependent methyltransferase [Candidatus Pacebacteria bacterium CG_4_10_14_0_8_um_filter_42_14]
MTKNKTNYIDPGSFRDPSGFVYYKNGKIYRQVSYGYQETFENKTFSDLLKKLVEERLIVPFKRANSTLAFDKFAVAVLEVEKIPFISYPYEWSFGQLRDAALLTLKIQLIAMEFGYSLKDASAYNVQFIGSHPIFIDHFSFEPYDTKKPWIAYKQFCEHFLGPLLLLKYTSGTLGKLQRLYLDGIPLTIVSKLLPKQTYLKPSIALHVHLHARNQIRYQDNHAKITSQISFSEQKMKALLDSLETVVSGLSLPRRKTEWGEYYTFTNYSDKAFDSKKNIVSGFISEVDAKSVWDIGANTGEFSRLASTKKIPTVAFDIDPDAVEKNYNKARESNDQFLLPLLMDFSNPSPGLGWNHSERKSLSQRGKADLVMALALIHHLAISNNLPLPSIAHYFASICKFIIIEFIPKEDSQVQKLLANREDIFENYDKFSFEGAFEKYFDLIAKEPILKKSLRTIYLYKAKE